MPAAKTKIIAGALSNRDSVWFRSERTTARPSTELSHAKCRAQAAFRRERFLENALVSSVNLRNCLRIAEILPFEVRSRNQIRFRVSGDWHENRTEIKSELDARLNLAVDINLSL